MKVYEVWITRDRKFKKGWKKIYTTSDRIQAGRAAQSWKTEFSAAATLIKEREVDNENA